MWILFILLELYILIFRVEHQARGAPHLHCMFWLEGEKGETPPRLYSEDDVDSSASCISHFAKSCISGSFKDVLCSSCSSSSSSLCKECNDLKELVQHYQTHSHRTTCLKRRKVVRIKSNEGHGKLDGVIEADELQLKTCRFDFPKNPSDETIFLPSLPLDTDPKVLKKLKADYSKIRKYLLRMTSGENFSDEEKWKNFKDLSFYDFLEEVGMFEMGEDVSKQEFQEKAKARYVSNTVENKIKSIIIIIII